MGLDHAKVDHNMSIEPWVAKQGILATFHCGKCGHSMQANAQECPLCKTKFLEAPANASYHMQVSAGMGIEYKQFKDDSEMLTWLELNFNSVFVLGHTWYARAAYQQPHHKCLSLRAAIIKARELREEFKTVK